MRKLEEVANSMDGVDQSYALQAGREIRVIARSKQVDDAKVDLLAADLASKIEDAALRLLWTLGSCGDLAATLRRASAGRRVPPWPCRGRRRRSSAGAGRDVSVSCNGNAVRC